MNSITNLKNKSVLHSRLFGANLEKLDLAEVALHQQKIPPVKITKLLDIWYTNWKNAYDRVFEAQWSEILRFGLSLGRLAESYSFHDMAAEILNRLAESARRREHWIPHPPSVLITAGEFNRRRGDLDRAEDIFHEAVQILEQNLEVAESRRQTHRELGRLFYELAYVHRLRCDAGATRSALERSEVDCILAEDELGAEIARSLLATVSYEEGFADSAVSRLKECLSRFELLVDDSAVKTAGRTALARRWVVNARIHLGQAHLAVGATKAAKDMIERQLCEEDQNPSTAGLATIKRIEAQLRLAEGNLGLAEKAIVASRKAIDYQGDMRLTELAAATVAITGLVNALTGSYSSAVSWFEQACSLPPNLHNRRAQAWAWVGSAILARKAGDPSSSLAAVRKGLDLVQRGGAPIRSFLLNMVRNSYTTGGEADLSDLKALVCRTG